LREFSEHGVHRTGDGLVGMETNRTIVSTPHESYGESSPQLAARCLVAETALEAAAQYMQFCLRHSPFQSQDQAIIEQSRMIHAIAVGEQGIGDGTHVE